LLEILRRHEERALESAGVEDRDAETGETWRRLWKKSAAVTQSVLVRWWNVAGNFLDATLVNKVSFFIAPTIIGSRRAYGSRCKGAETLADALELQDVEISQRRARH